MTVKAEDPKEKEEQDKEEFHEKAEALERRGVKAWLQLVLGDEGGAKTSDDLTGLELDAKPSRKQER